MKVTVVQGLVAVGLSMGLAACGPKLQSVADNQDASTETDSTRRETVTVGVNVSERGAGFNLAAASSYAMSLDGCASGLTVASITQANPSVDVYKFDQGCKVKLNSFVLSGITYAPVAGVGGDPFTTWISGDIATFEESGNASNKFTVTVTSQLGDPISGTEAVSYTFSQLVAGTDETIAKTVVGDSHALSVSGVDAASVDIVGVTMTGMAAGGAGQFTFKVECLTNITGTNPAYSCGNNLMTTLKYVLVEDTFGGTLTQTQANALFAGASTTVAAVDQFPVGTTGALKGGFNTQTLTGPAQMHLKPNMLLVVQSGGASYRYFNVDVSTLTYP
ncbi:MAG TPA: hypothetical protein VE954_19245 [Oligoflexus sp.]|uniref:hypothetical protein n=1 Tax=Oligoflexus sp. TaxID=1971216 RepID=UPI002D5F31EE|nr:hypothetical protein [Oligoflexus sp.]HYX35237.1 hypothetical protein [Oligoflexus sp.]